MSEMQETMSYGSPGMLSLLRESVGAAPLNQSKALPDAFSASRVAVSTLSGSIWEALTRRNEETGAAEGVVAYATDSAIGWAKRKLFAKGGLR